ncbi:MAG: sigma 54-interacting transcriptional regulator [Puniceicoccales bacterium]|nr:sigma 54-interacting transcriptional regulator [Puniceicoccales bacterium]
MIDCRVCNENTAAAAAAAATGITAEDSPCAPACRVVGELTLLHEISDTLSEGFESRGAALRMFKHLRDAKGFERGLLLVLNRETARLLPEASETDFPPFNARMDEGLVGEILASGRARAIPDVSLVSPDKLCKWEHAWLPAAGATSGVTALLVAPIRHGGELVGGLCFTRSAAPAEVLEADLRFLSLVVGQVGLALRFRQLAQERLDTLRQENARLQGECARGLVPEGIIGSSPAMRAVYFLVDQVAASKTTVLIRGETGVGKERVAEAIWRGGMRKNKPFVCVNCAALSESVIESELFGHEKGAFTGALALRRGRFEMANTGTLFLDEIGELSPSTQAKLLRVLQEGVFERVGGAQPLRVDVRVITATNRNLEEMIEAGKFRLDLYYRINVFPIHLPPLRERRGDLLELANHFLEKYAVQNRKRVTRISTPAIDMLTAYHWPGNVRELENVIERAVLLSTDGVVHGFHLPPTLQMPEAAGNGGEEDETGQMLSDALAAVEREMIVDALKANRGIMAKAARQLGITERTIGLRVKTLGIEPTRFRLTRGKEG